MVGVVVDFKDRAGQYTEVLISFSEYFLRIWEDLEAQLSFQDGGRGSSCRERWERGGAEGATCSKTGDFGVNPSAQSDYFSPFFLYINRLNNPKYGNLSEHFHIYLTAFGGGGSTHVVSLTAFLQFFYDFPYSPCLSDKNKYAWSWSLKMVRLLSEEEIRRAVNMCHHRGPFHH